MAISHSMNSSRPASSSFLPDFCGVRILFVVVLIGELLAIVLTLAQPGYAADRFSDLALFSLFIQWIAISCVGLLCVARPYLNRLPDQWAALLSYILVLLVALVISVAGWWLLYVLLGKQNYSDQSLGMFLARCMAISAIVSALALRYFYIQHQWRRQIESEAQARIEALQSRIRPHFLFNCMNTIASLTRSAPKQAEEAIEDLADLFRVSLGREHLLGPLADEISLCRRYLRIEGHRLGNRLQVEWEVEDLPGNARIPALTLQPLIENAIYHGIEQLQDGGTIRITGNRDDNRLTIAIVNPCPLSGSSHHGNRLAQDNVRLRLQACFGDTAELTTDETGDQYTITIRIPCRYEDTDR
ncbi:MAG TPA: histidine kinase [Gammaproteobacteria bacterium]|nr:histidine kinase [Gammaproteobacteria bacterium]